MRVTYHELVGRVVLDRGGRKVGRVADLRAAPMEGRLRVVGLLVGDAPLLARLGLGWLEAVAVEVGASDYFVPWHQVDSIGPRIRLKVTKGELQRVAAGGRAERSRDDGRS